MTKVVSISRAGRMASVLVLLTALASGCVRVGGPPARTPEVARPLPPHPKPTPRPPAPVPSRPPVDVLFAVQARLDRDGCSPGGLDGRWGQKSEKALQAWQKMHNLPCTGQPDEAVIEQLGSTNGILTTYTVTAADHAALTDRPDSWLKRSKMERMGYGTIEEMVAERFHLYCAALRRLNPQAAWPNPPAGTVLTVPSVKRRSLPRLSRLELRLGEKTLRAYDMKGQVVAQFPCSIAADKTKRPVGETLRVVVWAENPDYTFDPDVFTESPEAAEIGRRLRIPPGPNNPVGVAWIGLDRPGYGIHGTPSPEDISKTQSHGCIRLTNWDADSLIHAVRTDLPVVFLP